MCDQAYRVLYSPGVDAQLVTAHDEYPWEIAWLLTLMMDLESGAVTVEELRERGRLVRSDKDQTDYLYQHANAGKVCLSLAVDEAETIIEITAVMRITYTAYGPLQRERASLSGTRNS